MSVETQIAEDAAGWLAASQGEDMDWQGFTLWLEADDRHRQAYDQMALADDLLRAHAPDLAVGRAGVAAQTVVVAPVPVPVPVPVPARRRRWPVWTGGAIAASLAVVLVAGQFMPAASRTYATQGAAQSIALADGSTVLLAPRSRMTVSGDGGSQIALAGAAYFDIRHDPRRALAITAGPLTVTDIGTRFEIRQHPGDVVVEVAEGRVSAQATAMAAPMPLVAGKRLDFDMAAGRATVSTVAPQEVAAWRDGRLSYTSAPLELVARDLARYAGVRVEVPRALARRQFSGSLFISDGNAAVRDLAQLMQLGLRHDGAGWHLEPAR